MKLTKTHTTLTETSREVINALSKLNCVDKISSGIIKNTRSKSGQKSVKITETQSGLKIAVRGNGAVQDLYVYTKTPKEVTDALENIFKS